MESFDYSTMSLEQLQALALLDPEAAWELKERQDQSTIEGFDYSNMSFLKLKQLAPLNPGAAFELDRRTKREKKTKPLICPLELQKEDY